MSAAPSPTPTWCVYILRCADDTLYTGIAKNVLGRVELHNRGRGAKYTRSRRPVELVYREAQPNRALALRREAAIKRLPAAAKRALVKAAAKPRVIRSRGAQRNEPSGS